MQQLILDLASELCERPADFINKVEEKSLFLSTKDKGKFFFDIAIILYNSSYIQLALHTWENALRYFSKNEGKSWYRLFGKHDNRNLTSRCHINLANAHNDLHNYTKAIELSEKGLSIAKVYTHRFRSKVWAYKVRIILPAIL